MPKGRPIRNNQPQGHLNRAPTVQTYAQEKLRLTLDPNKPLRLDDEAKAEIDLACMLSVSVAAYTPQHSERLRAILRDMLNERIRTNVP